MGNLKDGEVFKRELDSLIQNTTAYLSQEVALSDKLSDPDRLREAWLTIGQNETSVKGPMILTEPKLFLAVLREAAELSNLYGDGTLAMTYANQSVTI